MLIFRPRGGVPQPTQAAQSHMQRVHGEPAHRPAGGALLGVRLLNRTTRKVAPDRSGRRAYYNAAGRSCTISPRPNGRSCSSTAGAVGTLRITSPIEFGQCSSPACWATSCASTPDHRRGRAGLAAVDPLREGVDIVIMIGQPDSPWWPRRLLSTTAGSRQPRLPWRRTARRHRCQLAGHRASPSVPPTPQRWPLSEPATAPAPANPSCNSITFAREAVVAPVPALPRYRRLCLERAQQASGAFVTDVRCRWRTVCGSILRGVSRR